jgi:hypothetical protein
LGASCALAINLSAVLAKLPADEANPVVNGWTCHVPQLPGLQTGTTVCRKAGAVITQGPGPVPAQAQSITQPTTTPASAGVGVGNQCIPDPDYGPAEPKYPGASCPQGQVTRVQAAFGQGCIGTGSGNPGGASWDPNGCSSPVSTYGLPCENLGPIIGEPSYDYEWSPACYLQVQASGGFNVATNEDSGP